MLDRTTTKPRIYFAGKIGGSDWRDCITGYKRPAGSVLSCEGRQGKRDLFDSRYTEDEGDFINGGPFYIWDDHIGVPKDEQHGIGLHTPGDMHLNRSPMLRRAAIFKVNLQRLRRADIVFAYINEADCFGTMVEIGQAQVFGKETHIGFGPKAPFDDMWMLRGRAKAIYMGSPKSCWLQFWKRRLTVSEFG